MLTIFILYSNDRKEEAQTTIECLYECDAIKECQLILCCDGDTNFKPEGFKILEIQRTEDLYCWANMWDAAVAIAKNEKILYIDSDRILPKNALLIFEKTIQEKAFVFPKELYSIKQKANTEQIKQIRDNPENHMDLLISDHRVYTSAWDAVRRKNPMSGCVGFCKNSFLETGGLDASFVGWGYPDTDYFEKTSRLNFQFLPIEIKELHLFHEYAIDRFQVKLMNLWNGIKFCKKWGYETHPKLLELSKELKVSIKSASNNTLQDFLKITKKGIKMA